MLITIISIEDFEKAYKYHIFILFISSDQNMLHYTS